MENKLELPDWLRNKLIAKGEEFYAKYEKKGAEE